MPNKANNVAPIDGAKLPSYPHSVEAEQAILGALMLNNRLYDDLQGILLAGHFYVPFHARVFEAMEHLIGKGWKADPLTVRETIKDRATFEKDTDLMGHFTAMVENASLTTDVRAAAEIIYNHHLQRSLIDLGAGLANEAAADATPEETHSLITSTESSLFKLAESGSSSEAQTLKNPIKAVIDQAHEARQNEGSITGVVSKFSKLDQMLGGFQRSDLIILAARPSMGKTAFVVNTAYNAARALASKDAGGAAVGIFSLEMSAEQLAGRILSSATGIDGNKLAKGQLDENDFTRLQAAAGELADLSLVIDDTAQLHINALRSRARRMKRQYNVGMIIVDYLQLMQAGSGRGGDFNRVQEISEISKGLKAIARELDVPVIALSQLSRAVEGRDNKRPQLSDLRESGSIEQDADLVMFLYREEYYKEKQFGPPSGWTPEQKALMKKIHGVAELLISKNRKGPTGAVYLQFTPHTTTFHDYQDETGYESSLEQMGGTAVEVL